MQKIILKGAFVVGLVIGWFLRVWDAIIGRQPRGLALIQCSCCGSNHVQVTSNVEEKKFVEDGEEYTSFKYTIRCIDCGRCAILTEKWSMDATPNKVYLNTVKSEKGVKCPYCGCDELIDAEEEKSISIKLPEGYKIFLCKKCKQPVCAVQEGLEDEEKQIEHKCNCGHCNHDCEHEEGRDKDDE